MKEPNIDIAKIFQSINGKIDGLTKQINCAHEEIIVLKKENSVLKVKLAVYETPMDYHNNIFPPSKVSLAVQAEKSKKLLATPTLRE